jgi:hypothetical protein
MLNPSYYGSKVLFEGSQARKTNVRVGLESLLYILLGIRLKLFSCCSQIGTLGSNQFGALDRDYRQVDRN